MWMKPRMGSWVQICQVLSLWHCTLRVRTLKIVTILISKYLKTLVFKIILAAMHDYDHPGRTNAFLVTTNSPQVEHHRI